MKTGDFKLDVQEIQKRARRAIEKGAVTGGYRADRDTVIRVLNEALATEIVCVLRYRRHYHMAQGIHAEVVAQEFQEHAKNEQEHVDRIAERITQLGGAPDFNPDGLRSRSHSEYVEGEKLADMIREDLVAERVVIQTYAELIRFLKDDDVTTRRLLEEILADEEEHADDLSRLLSRLDRQKI